MSLAALPIPLCHLRMASGTQVTWVCEEGVEGGTRPGRAEDQGNPAQGTYISQPEVPVFHDHIQHAAGHILVKDAGISHGLDGLEDDVCPLTGVEVSSKGLYQEGRKEDMCH